LPTGTQIAVAERQFIDYGATVSGSQALNYGGGGYVGGGEPALVTAYVSDVTRIRNPFGGGFINFPTIRQVPTGPPSNRLAGGGAGSWYIGSGITGITYGGSGIYAYSSKYGNHGDGSTGSSKNPGYLIVQKVNTPSTPDPALTVVGSEVITRNLTVGGGITAAGNIYGLDVIASSDIRTKENIVTIDSALSKVLGLHGVYFTRKNEEGRKIGVIAQEVEEVLPEVVYTGEDGMKSVSYGSIVGLLIEAIKEQNEQIKKLQV
jgi:hypothetical protein